MNQRQFRALAFLIASMIPAPVAAEIAIGFANPLSGPFAATGMRNRAAVSMAVEDINHRGGVLGEKVRVIAADDACGVDQAVGAARRLVQSGVPFVVGHSCSHSSLMAAGIYEIAGVLMITPASTHPRLTEEGRRNVFRLIGRDDRQGILAGDFIAQRYSGSNLAIAHDGTVYGQGVAAMVRRHLRRLGVKETLYIGYQPGADDYSALVSTLQSADIDVLYVGGYGPDAGLILRAAREQGDDLQLIGGDGLAMEEFWSVAGVSGDGTIFSARRSVHPDADAANIRASFRLQGLGPGMTGVGAYAAVEVWAQAVQRAGTDDLTAVAKHLRLGRFRTILGDVMFDAKGDLRGAAWEMQIWRNGNHEPIGLGTAVPSN